MSLGGKIVALIAVFLVGIIIGAVAAPLGWFFIRILGLVGILVRLLGTSLPLLGGALIGGGLAAVAMTGILKTLDETPRIGMVVGALGGAVGGLASSVIFFPFMAFL